MRDKQEKDAMYAAPDRTLLGEKVFSGIASTAISVGMVLALISLSGPGGLPQRVGAAIATFDLASPAGEAESAAEEQPAPAPPPPKAEPPAAPAKPSHAKVPELGHKPSDQAHIDDVGPLLIQPEMLAGPRSNEPLGQMQSIAQSQAGKADHGEKPQHKQASMKEPSGKPAPASGGQASSSYKAEVWHHLLRYRRPNVVGPGSAFVGFTLGLGGGVTDLSIVRSSGSKRFDGEAMQMVRRAQPFPKPPADVGRAFVFEIKGS